MEEKSWRGRGGSEKEGRRVGSEKKKQESK